MGGYDRDLNLIRYSNGLSLLLRNFTVFGI